MDDPRPHLLLVHQEGVVFRVHLEGRPLDLTAREQALLARLAREPGKVALQNDLLDELQVSQPFLHQVVYCLRNKLAPYRDHLRHEGPRAVRRGLPGVGSGYYLEGFRVEWVDPTTQVLSG